MRLLHLTSNRPVFALIIFFHCCHRLEATARSGGGGGGGDFLFTVKYGVLITRGTVPQIGLHHM